MAVDSETYVTVCRERDQLKARLAEIQSQREAMPDDQIQALWLEMRREFIQPVPPLLAFKAGYLAALPVSPTVVEPTEEQIERAVAVMDAHTDTDSGELFPIGRITLVRLMLSAALPTSPAVVDPTEPSAQAESEGPIEVVRQVGSESQTGDHNEEFWKE